MGQSPHSPIEHSGHRARRMRLVAEWVVRPAAIAAAAGAIVLVTTWPWSSFTGHTHWGNVRLLPWTLLTKPWEPLANVLLFVPFGAALQWSPARGRRGLVVLASLALSLGVEAYQLYTHVRIPSVPDLVVNTLGGWLGAQLVLLGAGQARATGDQAGPADLPIP